MAVVPYPGVEDRAAVERGRVVRVGLRQVEVHPKLLVLLPELEQLVGDADCGGLQLGLQVLVVGLRTELLDVGARDGQQRQEGPVRVVQRADVAAPQEVLYGYPSAHRAVVVEVDEVRHEAL